MELKPCPFCGGEAGLRTNLVAKIVLGICCDCGAKGPAVQYEDRLRGEEITKAIEAWNRRADDGT